MKQAKNIGEPIFPSVLRQQMAALEWTQERVAGAAQVSQASVNGWLAGSIPRADSLYNLARAMSVTMEFMLTGEDSSGVSSRLPDADTIRREERGRLATRLRKMLAELEA